MSNRVSVLTRYSDKTQERNIYRNVEIAERVIKAQREYINSSFNQQMNPKVVSVDYELKPIQGSF